MSDPNAARTPAEGGSYMRDPDTGALIRIEETPAGQEMSEPQETPEPAQTTQLAEAAASDPEPRKPRRRIDTEN